MGTTLKSFLSDRGLSVIVNFKQAYEVEPVPSQPQNNELHVVIDSASFLPQLTYNNENGKAYTFNAQQISAALTRIEDQGFKDLLQKIKGQLTSSLKKINLDAAEQEILFQGCYILYSTLTESKDTLEFKQKDNDDNIKVESREEKNLQVDAQDSPLAAEGIEAFPTGCTIIQPAPLKREESLLIAQLLARQAQLSTADYFTHRESEIKNQENALNAINNTIQEALKEQAEKRQELEEFEFQQAEQNFLQTTLRPIQASKSESVPSEQPENADIEQSKANPDIAIITAKINALNMVIALLRE